MENDFEEGSSQLKEGDPCPLCGMPLVLRHSPRGDFLGCSDYPSCTFMQAAPRPRTVTVVQVLPDRCPKCGAQVALKRGRFGLFIGCTNYPECDYIYTGAEKSKIKCPVCGEGVMVSRISKSGTQFYACSRYPSCTFSVPGKPVEKTCPRCSFPLMYEKRTKRGVKLACGNPLCPSRRHRVLRHRTVEPDK
jgi:putative DNA topoisomerase